VPDEEAAIDGRQLVQGYREFIQSYLHHNPASSAAGRALVAQAARWDLDLARMAATLAVMPPPSRDTVVRLESEYDESNEQHAHSRDRARLSAASAARAGADRVSMDAFQRARREGASRLAAEDRANHPAGPTPSPTIEAGALGLSAAVAGPIREADPEGGASSAPGGVCLIARFAADCADLLKAAALLHTDVATAEMARGAHLRAAAHRAIAGWLLWHLPRRADEAEDEAFVRDWLLAVTALLRGDGSLSSARQTGQLGLERFPEDEELSLATAAAAEAMATLCYDNRGASLLGGDCAEIPIAFDASQPQRPSLSHVEIPKQGQILRETERRLRALSKKRPADPEVRLRLGQAHAWRGKKKEAERELNWVITNARDARQVALAHLLLGRVAEARKDVRGVVVHARAAAAAEPDSQTVRMALANARLADGDREGALDVMTGLPTVRPEADDLWAMFLLGSMGRYAPARAALQARLGRP
jgi:hypothetical protein